MKGARTRYGYIDSIRGLAAVAVVYFHVADDFLKNADPKGVEESLFHVVTGPVDLGKVAVTLFFAVSGFVIPFSLLRAKDRPVRDFCIGRFFRLYPAYWLSIPFGLVAFNVLRPNPIDAPTVLGNATMLQQFVGLPNVVPVYWTLQIELIFYGLCVLLFLGGWLQSNRRVLLVALAMIALGALLAAARLATGTDFPVAFGPALAIMFFGVLWRRHLLDGDRQARRFALIALALLVLALPAIARMGYGADDWSRYTLTYYLALGLFVLLTTRLRLESRFLLFLGAISYSIYLFGSASRVFAMALLPASAGGAFHGHLVALLTLAITLAVASAVYFLVEKPAVRLGRATSRHLGHRAAPRPAGGPAREGLR
jgi:peptidoglycan/LPS O-acetylase OafA/YrhL